MSSNLKCPICGKQGSKVLMGLFPVKLCSDNDCSAVWGFGSWIACALMSIFYLPVNDDEIGFTFLQYTGSYLKALWHQLTSVNHGE